MSEQERGTDWLQRNARPLLFGEADRTDAYQTARVEAQKSLRNVVQGDHPPGRYTVTFSDRNHEVLYVESPSGDMTGAEWNLLELATTRALTRAYAWATGEGQTALAEVHPEADR